MSYTPTIIFDWSDLKREHVDDADAYQDSEHAAKELWLEIKTYLTEPSWLREFRGTKFASLHPRLTSHTTHYKDKLDEWKIEYFEVGG